MNAAVLAAELHEARLERRTVRRITDRVEGFTSADGYAVQREGIALRVDAGERIVGAKLGFTSAAMRRAMGVAEPNYGILTDAMVLPDGEVDLGELIHPKAEPEIAFVLGAGLGPHATAADVLAATDRVMACLEVVDSRFDAFSFLAADNIADDSSAGLVVLGDPVTPPADLRTVGVVLEVDGELAATAAGAAVLDHPAAAVAWAARRLASEGRALGPGALVISGGLTGPVDLRTSMTVRCRIDRVGTVELWTKEG